MFALLDLSLATPPQKTNFVSRSVRKWVIAPTLSISQCDPMFAVNDLDRATGAPNFALMANFVAHQVIAYVLSLAYTLPSGSEILRCIFCWVITRWKRCRKLINRFSIIHISAGEQLATSRLENIMPVSRDELLRTIFEISHRSDIRHVRLRFPYIHTQSQLAISIRSKIGVNSHHFRYLGSIRNALCSTRAVSRGLERLATVGDRLITSDTRTLHVSCQNITQKACLRRTKTQLSTSLILGLPSSNATTRDYNTSN